MNRKLLLVIFILIAATPVFSQAKSYVGWFFCIGGGPDAGMEITPLGIQFGVKFDKPFSFLLEVCGGLGFKDNEFDDSADLFGFNYHLGGLIDWRIEDIFLLGLGGGTGGGFFFGESSYSYPYIRGSASVLFGSDVKLGLYYDYCFKQGSMFGFRVHLAIEGE